MWVELFIHIIYVYIGDHDGWICFKSIFHPYNHHGTRRGVRIHIVSVIALLVKSDRILGFKYHTYTICESIFWDL